MGSSFSLKLAMTFLVLIGFSQLASSYQDSDLTSYPPKGKQTDTIKLSVATQFRLTEYKIDADQNRDQGIVDFDIQSVDPKYVQISLNYSRVLPQGRGLPFYSYTFKQRDIQFESGNGSSGQQVLTIDITNMVKDRYVQGEATLTFHILPHEAFPCQSGLKINVYIPNRGAFANNVINLQAKDQQFWCRNKSDINLPKYPIQTQEGARYYSIGDYR
jgi:hypothetical protein